MKINDIQKKLQELSALPYATETKLDGTTYRLEGNAPGAKFTPIRPKHPVDIQNPHAQAIELYGTEKNAAETIRRHIDTLGADLHPETLKRAESLCKKLERGHILETQYEMKHETVCRRGRYIRVQQATGVILGYRASMPFSEIAAAELGMTTHGWGYNQWLTLTLDEIAKLEEKYIITIR